MPAEEDHGILSDLAERLGLDEDETDNFVGSAMKRLGYKPRQSWDEPDPAEKGSGGGGDFFSQKREQRERRPTNPRRASGDEYR